MKTGVSVELEVLESIL